MYKNILIVKLRYNGDVLLTTPIISTLKNNYPNSNVDVLIYDNTYSIISENKEVNNIILMPSKKRSCIEKVKGFFCVLKKIKNKKYDLILNLSDQWSVAFLCRFMDDSYRISHVFSKRKNKLWNNSFDILTNQIGNNVVDNNLSILFPLNINKLYKKTTMNYDDIHWDLIKSKLECLNIDSNYILIQPTTRQLFKYWDDNKFAELIDHLHKLDYKVLLTSGPSTFEKNCVKNIANLCNVKPIIDFSGNTSFPELAALIDHALLFIGVDSAPMHIAAAVGTPIIALFGATDHVFWRANSQDQVQIWAGDYQSMPSREERNRSYKYLDYIPVIDVIKAVDRKLFEISQRK